MAGNTEGMILIKFLSLPHVLQVFNQLPHAPDPGLCFLGWLGYQVQVAPATAEDHCEAPVRWELIGNAEQYLRLVALSYCLYITYWNWVKRHTLNRKLSKMPLMSYTGKKSVIISDIKRYCIIFWWWSPWDKQQWNMQLLNYIALRKAVITSFSEAKNCKTEKKRKIKFAKLCSIKI